MKLDDVTRLRGSESTLGIEMVADDSFRRAAHDVVIENLPNSGVCELAGAPKGC